jgi:hypothetical protein
VYKLDRNVVLYFIFIKMVICFLLLRLVVFDAYSLYVSSRGQYCAMREAARAKPFCVWTLSGYNLKSAYDQPSLDVLDILALAFTIVSIAYFIAFRKHAYKKYHWLEYYDLTENTHTEEAFTLFLKNVPPFIERNKSNNKKSDTIFDYKHLIKEKCED